MAEKGKPQDDERRRSSNIRPLSDLIRERRQAAAAKALQESKTEMEFEIDDPYKQTNDLKGKVRKSTAYGYVPSEKHFSPWDPNHPEKPKRASAVHEALLPVVERMHIIKDHELIKEDDDTLLGYAYSPEYIKKIKTLCAKGNAEDAKMYDSIFFNKELSFNSAVQAAKMAISMSKLIAEGQYQNGFANIRPPGHHGTLTTPNGYCLVNNVALAAKYLLHHKLSERILIVDFDVHHGQGIQEIFYHNNKVLYFSIHRYEHGTFWPNLKESNFDYIGDKKGQGYNINVPLNSTGIGDYDYLAIVLNILLPVAYEYNPDLILVSAGFDSCMGDGKGRMNVTPAFYGHLIQLLDGLAGGKISVILEGGYFIPSLKEAALSTVRSLLNDPCNQMEYATYVHPVVKEIISDVKNVLRPYWKCFRQLDYCITAEEISKYDKLGFNVALKRYLGMVDEPPFPIVDCYPLNNAKEQQIYTLKLELIKEKYHMLRSKVGFSQNFNSENHNPPGKLRCQEVHNRIVDIMDKLKEFKLLEHMVEIELELDQDDPLHPVFWGEIWELMMKTHDPDYIRVMGITNEESRSDLYWSPESRETCQWSLSILCQLARSIKDGVIRYGIGIIRPPGHHAKYSTGAGFCLVNNVVITANYLINKLGYQKVLIIDFDVHHGDGTQDMTYSRNDIMYISMHRYDEGKFFPKDTTGNYTNIGEGNGLGYNVNIPFSKEKMENVDYLQTWIKVVLPMSYAYNPDIILVSAGFDAAVNDPLGNYNIFPEVFGHFLTLLKPLGPIIVALEGGYNFESTSLGMVNCAKALLGHPLPVPPMGDAKESTKKAITDVIAYIKPYWPFLAVNNFVVNKIPVKIDQQTQDKK